MMSFSNFFEQRRRWSAWERFSAVRFRYMMITVGVGKVIRYVMRYSEVSCLCWCCWWEFMGWLGSEGKKEMEMRFCWLCFRKMCWSALATRRAFRLIQYSFSTYPSVRKYASYQVQSVQSLRTKRDLHIQNERTNSITARQRQAHRTKILFLLDENLVSFWDLEFWMHIQSIF